MFNVQFDVDVRKFGALSKPRGFRVNSKFLGIKNTFSGIQMSHSTIHRQYTWDLWGALNFWVNFELPEFRNTNSGEYFPCPGRRGVWKLEVCASQLQASNVLWIPIEMSKITTYRRGDITHERFPRLITPSQAWESSPPIKAEGVI